MKKAKQQKLRNENTKYTISGRTDSSTIKKTNILQNLCPLKEQSCKKKNNTLHFPNTMSNQLGSLTKDKKLHKTSSRSIQLSRKYDMSRSKDQMKVGNELAIVPKVESPISNITSKLQIVSMPGDRFYNITDTISTISTSSVSSYDRFDIENNTTFTNIGNRQKSIPKVTSSLLCSFNSEHEINVLHYENDISSGNKFSYFATPLLNSNDTNWRLVRNTNSTKINDNMENLNDKQHLLEDQQKQDMSKAIRNIKYSWETIDSWISARRREYNNLRVQQYLGMYNEKPHDRRIKYSWQIVGTSTQTSHSLLQELLNDSITEDHESPYKMCSIKYSWQVIGTSTQACLHDYNDSDYWKGTLLTPNRNYNKSSFRMGDSEGDVESRDHAKYPKTKSKRYLILNNQQTQTFAEKNVQADVNDYYYAKYSWHNLIKKCL